MIETLTLQNFRGHEATTVPLSPFTLIYGDNATGKTSILQAIKLLGDSFLEAPSTLFSGSSSVRWLARNGSTGPVDGNALSVISARGLEKSDGWNYTIQFDAHQPRESLDASWYLGPEFSGLTPLREVAQSKKPPLVTLGHQLHSVAPRFIVERLAEPSTSFDEIPRVQPDGGGLATSLQFLKITDEPRFRQLEFATRTVIPHLEGLHFGRKQQTRQISRVLTVNGQSLTVPETETFIAENLLLKYANATEPLPAHTASEGTLLVLGLLALLYLPNCPRVLLIDDIDRALHPRAQAELVKMLRSLLASGPDLQIIATSHSPYLADSFKSEEVVVLGRPNDGPVVARRLSDHPDKKLSKVLSTGEFLTASGPEWFGKLAP